MTVEAGTKHMEVQVVGPACEEPGMMSETERELDDAAQKLKVLGHPVRLKLLCVIAKQDDPCVSDLWVCVNQPQPVVSQHLAVLKDKGIVRSEIRGNKRTYSIVDPFVEKLVRSIDPEAQV